MEVLLQEVLQEVLVVVHLEALQEVLVVVHLEALQEVLVVVHLEVLQEVLEAVHLEVHQEGLEVVLLEVQEEAQLEDLRVVQVPVVALVEDLRVVSEEAMMLVGKVEVKGVNPVPWKKIFLEYQVMTIQSFLRFLKHLFSVMVWLMGVTMLTQKLSAKHSIFVPMMEMGALPNTASCVPMEQFSSNNILCVIGGLMWIALLLKSSILLMKKLQQKEKQTLEEQVELEVQMDSEGTQIKQEEGDKEEGAKEVRVEGVEPGEEQDQLELEVVQMDHLEGGL